MPLWRGGYRRRLGLLATSSDGGRQMSRSPIWAGNPGEGTTGDQEPQLKDVVADLFLTNVLSGSHAGLLARAGEQSGGRDVSWERGQGLHVSAPSRLQSTTYLLGSCASDGQKCWCGEGG